MDHVYYFDGNSKEISWEIQTKEFTIKQKREHVIIYKNKVTKLQSKIIALHVGLFWAIGTFIIKNHDEVKIRFDEKVLYENFRKNLKNEDEFIEKRIQFIQQLVNQRKLKMKYELIEQDKNVSKKTSAKELKTKND